MRWRANQTVILALLSGSSLILNFLYQWLVVALMGAGIETDAFFAGASIPVLVLSVASASLTHVLVPILAKLGEAAFYRVVWSLIWYAGAITAAISLGIAMTAEMWTIVVFPGFSDEGRALLAELSRIQIFNSIFFVSSTILWSAFNSRSKFVAVELTGLAASALSMAAFLLTFRQWGVYAAACCSLIRPIGQTIILGVTLGGIQRPKMEPSIKDAWRKGKVLISASLFTKTEPILDRSISAFGAHGDLTHLHLATQIIAAGQTVLGRAIVAPMVTRLSNYAATNATKEYHGTIKAGILKSGGVGLLGAFAMGLFFVAYKYGLLGGVGRYSDSDFRMLSAIMLSLSGFWVAGCLGQVMGPYFYCQGNTRTPAIISVIGFVTGLIFKVVGFQMAGIVGVAIGTSAGSVAAILLYFLAKNVQTLRGINGSANCNE